MNVNALPPGVVDLSTNFPERIGEMPRSLKDRGFCIVKGLNSLAMVSALRQEIDHFPKDSGIAQIFTDGDQRRYVFDPKIIDTQLPVTKEYTNVLKGLTRSLSLAAHSRIGDEVSAVEVLEDASGNHETGSHYDSTNGLGMFTLLQGSVIVEIEFADKVDLGSRTAYRDKKIRTELVDGDLLMLANHHPEDVGTSWERGFYDKAHLAKHRVQNTSHITNPTDPRKLALILDFGGNLPNALA